MATAPVPGDGVAAGRAVDTAAARPVDTAAARPVDTAAARPVDTAAARPVDMAAARRFRRVLGHVPTGVTLITATTPAGPAGMAVNSFTSVSLDPPLISFCAARTSTTWPLVRAAGAFSVNVLGESSAELCRRFARKDADRFAGVRYRLGATGAPVLPGLAASLDCALFREVDAGDHVIVLGRVVHLESDEGVRPLVFHAGRYCGLPPSESAPSRAGAL